MAWGRRSKYGYRGFNDNHGIVGRHPDKDKKYIHKSGMVAHLWANQSQDMARNAKGTIFFKGPVLYSFTEDWPLAIITDRKAGEKTIVLRNVTSDSVTTNGQWWDVRNALEGHPEYECVMCDVEQARLWVRGEQTQALAGIVQDKLDELKAEQDRLMNTRLGRYNSMEGCEYALDDTELRQLANTLGVPVPDYDLSAMRAAIAETARKYREGEPKREKARLRREKRACLDTLAKWKTQHTPDPRTQRLPYVTYRSRISDQQLREAFELAAANYPMEKWIGYVEDMQRMHYRAEIQHTFEALHPQWRRAKNLLDDRIYDRNRGGITLNEWLKGKSGSLRTWHETTLMRKRNGRLETTQGVEVPWQHAKRAFEIAINCYIAKGEYVAAHTFQIGHFTLDRIDADGTLHAGCHRLKFKDMLALACQEEPELAARVTARYSVPMVI